MMVWKPIPDFPGYSVNERGEILSERQGSPRLRRLQTHKDGYKSVVLRKNGKYYYRTVHSLVALVFIGPRPANLEVRHKNFNPTDNRVENLVYGTSSENKFDTVVSGNHYNAKKTHCPSDHEYTEENTYIHDGRRYCRKCREK